MKLRIPDYKIVKEQLGEDMPHVSCSFWMDELLKEHYIEPTVSADKEDIRWLMLLAYQRGYAKAVEDGAIPEFDEYDESEAYERN